MKVGGICLFILACLTVTAWAEEDTKVKEEKSSTCEDHPAASKFCQQAKDNTDSRRGCQGYLRMMSSSPEEETIVFKLLENLWHNCPKSCFDCDITSKVTPQKISDSEKFLGRRLKDPYEVMKHSPEVDVDRWLEVNAVLEHMFVCENAEDAAQGKFENTTVCERWKDELKTVEFVAETSEKSGTTVKHCADVKLPQNLDVIATYNLSPNLKDGMHWWCRETCRLCSNQDNLVDPHFFRF